MADCYGISVCVYVCVCVRVCVLMFNPGGNLLLINPGGRKV